MDRFTLFPPIVYRPSTKSPIVNVHANSSKIDRGHQDDFVLITSANNNSIVTTTNANASPRFIGEGWSIALIVLTSVRLLIVLSLWIYLTKRILSSKVPLSRVWHSQLLLASLAFSHLILYAFVLAPTPFSCSLIRIGVGLAYAIPYALLTLKLILIASAYRGYDLPQFHQSILLLSFIGIQIGLSAQWLTLVPVANVIQADTCGISVGEWLRHLVYVVLLMLCGTTLAVATRHIKCNHRDSMFLGLALGLNIPVWLIWGTVGTLVRGKPGFDDRCIAFGLFITTSIVLFVMFLPRSRQMVVVGVGGLYTEDSAPVTKPISELTIHKLYYPVYGERQLSSSVNGGPGVNEQTNESNAGVHFRMSSHWYPPLNDAGRPAAPSSTQMPSSASLGMKRSQGISRPYHFDDVVSVHHHNQLQQQPINCSQQLQQRQMILTTHQNGVRCLTPPSEEGSTTSSSSSSRPKRPKQKPKGGIDVEEEEEDTDLDMGVGKYHERNVDSEILSYSQVVAHQQPMY